MRHNLVSLALGFVVFALEGFAQPTPNRSEKSTRFTPDQIRVLEQITYGYRLNGKHIDAGSDEQDVLPKLKRSDDRLARELAGYALEMKALRKLLKEQNAKARQAFADQVKEWPLILVPEIVKQLTEDEKKQFSAADAAKFVEDLIGNDGGAENTPQQEVNKAWAYAYLGQFVETNHAKVTMRKMAAGGRQTAGPSGAVKVTVGKDARDPHLLTIENTTKDPLTHCLILVRLQPDRARIDGIERDEAFTASLLPLFGFSGKTTRDSALAATLRNACLRLDKGAYVYIPSIPARGTVTTWVDFPPYFLYSKGLDVSVCCDAWQTENIPAENWNEAKAGVEKLISGNGKKSGPSVLGMKDLFQAGSVWEDGTRKLAVLERSGNTFKAKFVARGIERDVVGTVKNGTISWLSKDVTVVKGDKGGDNTGILGETQIDFSWVDVEGKPGQKFTLRLRKQ